MKNESWSSIPKRKRYHIQRTMVEETQYFKAVYLKTKSFKHALLSLNLNKQHKHVIIKIFKYLVIRDISFNKRIFLIINGLCNSHNLHSFKSEVLLYNCLKNKEMSLKIVFSLKLYSTLLKNRTCFRSIT